MDQSKCNREMVGRSPKTLYVSDLDGTLLNSRSELSDFTVKTINTLCEQGMLFSYASARSYTTASEVTAPLTASLPVITYNGALVLEQGSGKRLLSNVFSKEDARGILDELLTNGVCPVVYALIDGTEKYSYCRDRIDQGVSDLLSAHPGDARERGVDAVQNLLDGDCFCFACSGERARMEALYEHFRNRYQCWYFQGGNGAYQRLQLRPQTVTKGNAIRMLKQYLGCERVVCFGDGNNDFEMFEAADECYAMANADPRLKERATAVIGSNDADGVAEWLLKNAMR
jgi:Cof subfamily protein (haloacid dehalogenase superfamily)